MVAFADRQKSEMSGVAGDSVSGDVKGHVLNLPVSLIALLTSARGLVEREETCDFIASHLGSPRHR